ncbi:hypothetical protein BD626DRAFT_508696 [Schizophyllum amplum]|uniref:SH3 domain-containing protein n=1 Tax=Schizophyllum amplum TaxID=97359 RepID=A0A550C381_9AGAR|nr:hypothetical protein BD626DRAFT_508696 [Auriculariopsis ampla]
MRGIVYARRLSAERAQLATESEAQRLAARATTITTFVTVHPSQTAAQTTDSASAPAETTQASTSLVTSTMETETPSTSSALPTSSPVPETTESSEPVPTTTSESIIPPSSFESSSFESSSAEPTSTSSTTPFTSSSTITSTHPLTSSILTSSGTSEAIAASASSGSASAVSGNNGNQGLSSGAIAGITVAAIIGAFALGFLCLFIIRKRALARRRRSDFWISGPIPDELSNTEQQRPASLRPFFLDPQRPAPPPPPKTPASPSVTYGNVAAAHKKIPSALVATVSSTYTPSMPDELSVTVGDKLTISREFDDGWCECVNAAGRKGMVPLECLEGRSWWSAPQGDYLSPADRRSQRVSSLYASYAPPHA